MARQRDEVDQADDEIESRGRQHRQPAIAKDSVTGHDDKTAQSQHALPGDDGTSLGVSKARCR